MQAAISLLSEEKMERNFVESRILIPIQGAPDLSYCSRVSSAIQTSVFNDPVRQVECLQPEKVFSSNPIFEQNIMNRVCRLFCYNRPEQMSFSVRLTISLTSDHAKLNSLNLSVQ